MNVKTLAAMSALALATAIPPVAHSAPGEEKRMSLNPYGSFLDNGAHYVASQSDGPLVLPLGNPEFSHGFTVPEDYTGGPIGLEMLVASQATNCVFDLRTNFVFHARTNHVGPIGTDLMAQHASVPYLTDNQGILFAAPGPAERTVLLRWDFEEFESPFYPGDAFNFGIFRAAGPNHEDDSCEADLHVTGLSIVYGTGNSKTGTRR